MIFPRLFILMFLCLSLAVQAQTLSVDGSARLRLQSFINPDFTDAETDDIFFQRYTLKTEWRPNATFGVMAELISAFDGGRVGGSSPVDSNDLDFNQIAVRLKTAPKWELLAGRQTLRLGSQRLVGIRLGTGIPIRYDGVRWGYEDDRLRVDLIGAVLVDSRLDAFDDRTDDVRGLYGAYATLKPNRGWLSWDIYALGYQNRKATYLEVSGKERRYSLGSRMFGERGAWDMNWEALAQFGTFAGRDIRAWTLATITGYRFAETPWRPRLALSTNIASGDTNPDDDTLETFNPLFPRGNYFSHLAFLGPRNFYNAHLFLTVHPRDDLSVTVESNFYQRLEDEDGLYGPPGFPLVIDGNATSDQAAVAVSLGVAWTIADQWTMELNATQLTPKDVLRQPGRDRDLRFVEWTLFYQF